MTKTTPRCIATTAKGDQCAARAMKGRAVCAAHAMRSRFEDLEAPSLDIVRQALTADAETIDPQLRIKMALQVLDRVAKQPPAARQDSAQPREGDLDLDLLTPDEKERLANMLGLLRDLKADVKARLAREAEAARAR